MNEKQMESKGKPQQESKEQSRQNAPSLTGGKPISSGITQPHNANKESLGPNTKR